MTPRKFEEIGNKLIRYKKPLWLVVLLSLFTLGSLLFSIYKFNISGVPQVFIALPIFAIFFAWGLLLSIYWFSLEGKMNSGKIDSYSGIKKSLNVFFAWYGAVFLSIWYIVVMLAIPWYFWSMIASGG
jgi:hypothetical protein